MYHAKQAGRNGYQYFVSGMSPAVPGVAGNNISARGRQVVIPTAQ